MSFLGQADFWNRTLQNWQSEFLAVGDDGRLLHLSAPARLGGVEARGRTARRDRIVELKYKRAVVGNEPDHDGLREPPVAEVVRDGDTVIVTLAGELDLYNAEAVRDVLIEECARQA